MKGDRGSVTLELVILAPALLMLLSLAIVAGRIEVAHGAVEQASAAAARDASIARTSEQAQNMAQSAATGVLDQRRLHCASLSVGIDTAGFTAPVGQPAQVASTVTCVVDFGALLVPGLPGSKTITARTASVLDTYRAR